MDFHRRVGYGDLWIDEDSRYYLGEEPFTGTYEQHYTCNGVMSSEEEFVDGYPEGWHRKWYENGQLKLEVYSHKDCFTEGYLREWHENGQPKRVAYAENGKTLESRTWDEAGNLTILFSDKEGCLREWYENGQPSRVGYSENGMPVEEKYWDKAGNLTSHFIVPGRSSVIPDSPFQNAKRPDNV